MALQLFQEMRLGTMGLLGGMYAAGMRLFGNISVTNGLPIWSRCPKFLERVECRKFN